MKASQSLLSNLGSVISGVLIFSISGVQKKDCKEKGIKQSITHISNMAKSPHMLMGQSLWTNWMDEAKDGKSCYCNGNRKTYDDDVAYLMGFSSPNKVWKYLVYSIKTQKYHTPRSRRNSCQQHTWLYLLLPSHHVHVQPHSGDEQSKREVQFLKQGLPWTFVYSVLLVASSELM